MKFNVDFDDAGWLAGTATTPLGNLVLHNIDAQLFHRV